MTTKPDNLNEQKKAGEESSDFSPAFFHRFGFSVY